MMKGTICFVVASGLSHTNKIAKHINNVCFVINFSYGFFAYHLKTKNTEFEAYFTNAIFVTTFSVASRLALNT